MRQGRSLTAAGVRLGLCMAMMTIYTQSAMGRLAFSDTIVRPSGSPHRPLGRLPKSSKKKRLVLGALGRADERLLRNKRRLLQERCGGRHMSQSSARAATQLSLCWARSRRRR
jgi:hypothetical protein